MLQHVNVTFPKEGQVAVLGFAREFGSNGDSMMGTLLT
jgi:hypothetical protein